MGRARIAPEERAPFHILADESRQHLAQLGDGKYVVDVDVLQRAARHRVDEGIVRILHDGKPALALDGGQPRRSVVERPGQHDTDHARPERIGRRPEERIDRGPMPVFARAADDADVVLVHEQVMIGPGHVDPVGEDGFAVSRMLGGQGTGRAEDLRQDALMLRRQMQDNEHRRWEVGGKPPDERRERFDAAGGSADHDDVARGHPNRQCTPVFARWHLAALNSGWIRAATDSPVRDRM